MSVWDGKKEKDDTPIIRVNGLEVSNANEEQIRHFVRALDLQMKNDLFEFLKGRHSGEFQLWLRILSEEIQHHDTESRFPLTRDENIGLLIKIMYAYDKLPEEDRKILLEILLSDEIKMTMREVGTNEVKIIALNKAIHDVDLADGAVALISLITKNSDDRKELALSGIRFVLKNGIGNPEAAFRLLKLIDEKTKLAESEKETVSKFLNILDPDFLEIHLGDRFSIEIKKIIVGRLVYAASKLKWIPKAHPVEQVFKKHKLAGK